MEYIIERLSMKHSKYLDSLIDTYKNLSEIGNISVQNMIDIMKEIQQQGTITYLAVSTQYGIIGSCTLLLEKKFQRGGSFAGHIEDVVVRKGFEGNGIASKLVQKCINHAKTKKCYKIILDCDKNLSEFYTKFGFKSDGVFMRQYL